MRLIPIAAEWFKEWRQPNVYSLEWRLRQRYASLVRAQMQAFICWADTRELLKALAIGEGPIRRPISDTEFFLYHQRAALARCCVEYKFSKLVLIVSALDLFKDWQTKDVSSMPSRSRLGLLFHKIAVSRRDMGICGVSVEFNVVGQGKTRRYVVTSGPSSVRAGEK